MVSLLWRKITENKRTIMFLFLLVVGFFTFSDIILAAGTSTGSTAANSSIDETLKSVQKFLDIFMPLIAVIMALFSHLVTLFLSPLWMNGTIFGLTEYLKTIWILISNLVYLIFALIIIWIAFMNIIGKGGEKYGMKQALPKLIIGILIVPLSWFFVQAVMSASSRLTGVVLTLPSNTFIKYEEKLKKIEVPLNCTIDVSKVSKDTDLKGKDPNSAYSCTGSGNVLGLLNGKNVTDSIYGVLATYVYGVIGIENIDKLAKTDLTKGGIKTIGDVLTKIVFDLVFFLVYIILIIAIGMVLLTRGIYLWIYIMISPIFGLMYFFGKTSEGIAKEGAMSKFSIKEFLNLALVPVYTMLALSFGLLFLFVIGNGMATASTQSGNLAIFGVEITKEGDDSILKIGSATLKIKGPTTSQQNISPFFKEIAEGGLGIVGVLIMKVLGIVVLWSAVMAALRSSKITGELIEPIYNFGNQVGATLKKLPQYAPIIPAPGGMQSMQSMGRFGGLLNSHFETKAGERSNKLADAFGLNKSALKEETDALRKAIATGTQADTATALNKLAGKAGDIEKLFNDSQAREQVVEAAKKLGISNPKADSKEDLQELMRQIKEKESSRYPGTLSNVGSDGRLNSSGGGSGGTPTKAQSEATANTANTNVSNTAKDIIDNKARSAATAGIDEAKIKDAAAKAATVAAAAATKAATDGVTEPDAAEAAKIATSAQGAIEKLNTTIDELIKLKNQNPGADLSDAMSKVNNAINAANALTSPSP